MFVGQEQDWLTGEEQAWDIISQLEPQDVSRRAKVAYDSFRDLYMVPFFNTGISVSPKDRHIWGNSLAADSLLNKLHHYSSLSVLWYLIQAKDIPLSGELTNPAMMNGGLIFAKGTHVLPLDKMANKYGNDVQGFLRRGTEFGGERLDYGDACLRLLPFPKVPVVLLLWQNDEEFPARADLLFDATCSAHLPVDIIWSTAMMSLLIIL